MTQDCCKENMHEIQLSWHRDAQFWKCNLLGHLQLSLPSRNNRPFWDYGLGDPYFDDGCNLLSHHRALQSEPPHLQREQLSHYDFETMSTTHTKNTHYRALRCYWFNLG